MSIQASINNMLSVAGVLAGMNPEIRAKAETRNTLQNLGKRKEAVTEARDIAAEAGQSKVAEQYQETLGGINKQIFEVSPSEESFEEYAESSGLNRPTTTTRGDPLEIAQEIYEEKAFEAEVNQYVKQMEESAAKAQNNLQAKQAEKRSSRRFMDYLKDEPTSLGVNVGALSKSAQKEIAKNYTKAERTRIMNAKDLERKQNG
jgi:hypothetical protein